MLDAGNIVALRLAIGIVKLYDIRHNRLRKTGGLAVAVRRKAVKRRVVVSALGAAAEMIGDIAPGEDICGVTMGQFSLIDLLEHLLNQTGPADVAISTWTAGIYDQERAAAFYANGRIRSIKWLVDPSMFGRRPELAGSMIAAFGVGAFRSVNTHAKFMTISNDRWSLVVRSSMNLNPNKRLENFDISDCPKLLAFFDGIVGQYWRELQPSLGGSQAEAVFQDILARYTGEHRPQVARRSRDEVSPAMAAFLAAG